MALRQRFLILSLLAWIPCLAAPLAADEDRSLLYDAKGAVAGLDLEVGAAFDTDSVQLNDFGKAMLAQFIQRISQDPTTKLAVYGYSDTEADKSHDRRQSYGRALEVKASMSMLGFPVDSVVSVVGLGASGSVAEKDEGARQDGRVEVRIVGMLPQHLGVAGPGAVIYHEAKSPAKTGEQEGGDQGPPARFALGMGYPDVRARLALGAGWDLEGKAGLEQGIQVYSGRLYWNCLDLGPLKAELGAEGGYAQFNGVDTLDGNAVIMGGFVGLEYPFARRLRVSVDVGPAYIQASSQGYSYSTTEIVYNTALYLYLF